VTASTVTTPGQTLLEAGCLSAAREQFWEEAANASDGDAEALAVAALGLGGLWVHEHRSTVERARVVGLQRRALVGLDPSTSLAYRLRIRLIAEDAYVSGELDALLAELDAVRIHADPIALAEALSLTHHCLLGPGQADLRLELADELIAASTASGRPLDTLMGLAWRTVDLFLAGDGRAVRSLHELEERLARHRCDGLAYLVAALDVTAAMRAGRLEEAEQLADACLALGQDVGDADALGWFGAQLVAIRWMQGRSAELLPLLADLAESTTVAESNDGFVAAIAALAAESGDHDTAATALAAVRARGLDARRSSSCWLAIVAGVCEAAHALGDAAAAQEAYDLLAPFSALPVLASLGVACYGSAHRPLGLAARTWGDLDLAVDHLERAAAADLAFGNRPCRAIDLALLAECLEQRDGADDARRAAGLWREAISAAHKLGMTGRAADWERQSAPEERPSAVTLQRQGQLWSVRAGERTASVSHCVGLEYLGQLVEHEGRSVAAVELASRFALTCRGAHVEPVIDDRAKAAYRRRIEELREELDDAESCADLERASRARAELDAFVEGLARSTGFAGRTRSFDDEAERARVSVHKAIKRAVARIGEIDPAIGREIDRRVVTGMLCVFLAAPA
jgi:tetratricopeptide (TPR) repeat protein